MRYEKRQFKLATLLKWVAAGVFAILLLAGAAAVYLNYHWKPILSKKIKDAVAKGSDGLYRLDFKDLYVNVFTGYISVEQPELRSDSLVYEHLKQAGKAPQKVFNIRLNRLILEDTHPWKAWRNKEIDVASITIDRPQIRVSIEKDGEKKPADHRTLYDRISKSLRSISIGKIYMNTIALTVVDKREEKPRVTALNTISLRITDVLIDSTSQQDTARFYSARDVFIQMKNYAYATPDSLYRVKLGELSASTREGYLSLNNLKVIPRYGEMQFSHKYKVQHERYAITFPEIRLNKVDFNAYDTSGKIEASSLLINRVFMQVFLNRSLPPPPIDKWVNFPHVLLQRMKQKITVHRVNIRKSTVYYTEFNPLSGKSGTVFFSGITSTLTNVTNDSIALRQNHHTGASITALLSGKTRLHVNLSLNLTDPAGAFQYSGSTGYLDLTSLNALNRPLSLLEVKSGIVRKAEFNVAANRYGANGTLKLYYSDLKINLLKKNDEGELKKKGALSLLANALLVKNDNPARGEPLRIGVIHFERPHSSAFFNLLWKGVFVGIKESVGLGMIKEKNVQPKKK